MAYLYSTGSRGLGDIEFEGDPDETQIDFEDDFIALKTGGNQVLVVSGSSVGVGTAVRVTTYTSPARPLLLHLLMVPPVPMHFLGLGVPAC